MALNMLNNELLFKYLLKISSDLIIFFDASFRIQGISKQAKKFFPLERNQKPNENLLDFFNRYQLKETFFNNLKKINQGKKIPLPTMIVPHKRGHYLIDWEITALPKKYFPEDLFVLQSTNIVKTLPDSPEERPIFPKYTTTKRGKIYSNDQADALKEINKEIMGIDILSSRPNKIKQLLIFLRAIVANMPGNVYWKDKNSTYLGCNNNVLKITGTSSRAEITGKDDFYFEKILNWPVGTAARFRQDDIAVINSKTPLIFEDRFIQADSKKVIMLTTKSPIFDNNGKVIGIIATSIDITERKRAEENLYKIKVAAAEAKRLDNIIEYAPGMIYWKNKNSIYLGCNDQFAIAAGYANRTDIYCKSDNDIPWSEGINASIRDDKMVMESGKPKYNIEEIIHLPNGEKTILLTNKVPLHDSSGEIIGILGISKDITRRKEMEEELCQVMGKISLQDSQICLKNIMENLPQYVYWKDRNLVYQGCNNHVAQYLGLNSPLEIVGKTDNDFNWDEARIKFLHQIDTAILQEGITNVVEDVIPKEDGSARIMLSSKAPLRNESNEIVGILGVSFDITD